MSYNTEAMHGFPMDELEAIADALDSCYDKTVNVGNTTGDGDEHVPSSTAVAARFIRAALAQQAAPPAAQAETPRITGRAAIVDAWNALPNGLRIDANLAALWRAISACDDAAAPTPAARAEQSAKARYDECMSEGEERDPIERLRFFCSLAMNGQDWLDVEPFFDAIKAPAAQAGDALPPLPVHPEIPGRPWSPLEERAIRRYGERCVRAALAARGAQAVDAWINVEDRLPEPGQPILAAGTGLCAGLQIVVQLVLDEGDAQAWLLDRVYDEPVQVDPPTHWQPLPAAPRAALKGQPEGGVA